ncbi:uncharacterized protein OCT59_005831 [Rhizophagus irregularis]|uniref:uncharacterized protein n=1 Tax=Rhizophagus irregularis TaxID=588596 RepID=UPI0033203C85|nr:hypothetical protein OCT59_005831 [Rhizophagus irregularis]
MEQERIPNKEVALKFLSNSQNNDIINELLNEIESYSVQFVKYDNIVKIYGISQNQTTKDYIIVLQNGYCKICDNMYSNIKYKWCKQCLINDLKQNFANWTSENEKIDKFIQRMQLEIDKLNDTIIEWISYNQFNNIKVLYKNDSVIIYSAIFINGPLYYNYDKMEWERKPNEKVTLICLNNSQITTDEFLNKIKTYIDEKHIRNYVSNKIVQGEFATLYSADWMNGLLDYEYYKWKRTPNLKVTLKYLYNSQDITEEYLYGQIRSYSSIAINKEDSTYNNPRIYGISQNPNTKDYIVVLENGNHCEKCGEIYTLIYIKWCESCQISESDFAMLYSAIWMNGPLEYDKSDKKEWIRMPNKKVALKYLCNSQNINNEFLNKETKLYVKSNEYDITKIYGISQNPDTKNYVIVLQDGILCDKCKNDSAAIYSAIWNNNCDKMEQKRIHNKEVTLKYLCNSQNNDITNEFLSKIKTYFIEYDNIIELYGISQNSATKDYIMCKSCQINDLKNRFGNWTSGNKIIDELIQEEQLKIKNHDDIIVEWMPYYRFGNIKKVNKSDTTLQYSAIWMNGPLKYNGIKWERIPNKKVTLKYLCSSQNITNEILNEVNSYFIKVNNLPLNQPTDYSRILHPTKDISPKIYGISQNPITRDYFIVIKVYSALWENGPLQYNTNYEGLERDHSIEVALKCLHDSQNISNGLLNEVKNYSINHNKILKIYGISQNPITKDYIIVLQLASEGFVNSRYIKKPWYRIEKLYILYKIIDCLEIIHNNQTVHRDLHIGNILILPSDQFSDDICIMDMGLCKEVDNISNTVYGVMPYVAPEILRGKPYTQAADIYSFGMIMYFVATRRQTFANCAHDGILALNICNGIRPEINEQEAPKCYIELMKKCWSSNPDDRPKAIEIKEEINKQIEEAIRNKKFRFLNIGSNQSTVHPKACYTSRLLNPFTKNLPK